MNRAEMLQKLGEAIKPDGKATAEDADEAILTLLLTAAAVFTARHRLPTGADSIEQVAEAALSGMYLWLKITAKKEATR